MAAGGSAPVSGGTCVHKQTARTALHHGLDVVCVRLRGAALCVTHHPLPITTQDCSNLCEQRNNPGVVERRIWPGS